MASQYYINSMIKSSGLSSCKPKYPWRLVSVSRCKSSWICKRLSSSILPCATSTKSLRQYSEVILPEVDINVRMNELQQTARRALMANSDPTTTMEVIDTIQRLGIGNIFEEEIHEALENLTQGMPDDNLYTVALRFRLQRHNGLHTNPDVFKKFLDANGEFKESLREDIEALLSLYEASHLGAKGEDILTQAKKFTKTHLKGLVSQLSPKLGKQVLLSLDIPRHMRMVRLEERRYIEEYGEADDHNPVLLELAKLNYNHVQSLLQSELSDVTRWWNHLGLSSKLSFVRDRHIECFLWAVGVLPEAKYSGSRIVLAKNIAIMLVIDDIYDMYGSYEDLVLFTKAIRRWDLNEIEQLPEYMKICYMALYNTSSDICDKILKERGLSAQSFLRKTSDIVEGYMVEFEWVKRGCIPNLEDYIRNGYTTSGTCMALVHLFFLISDGVTEENMRHVLDPYPKFFSLFATILRLWDDLGTTKEEEERGDTLSSIQVLMREKKINNEEEGRTQILQLIQALWADLNVELVKPDTLLLPIIKVALNLSRASQVVYQHDKDSYLSSVESYVQSLFFKPIFI